jgi:hypothetical protein
MRVRVPVIDSETGNSHFYGWECVPMPNAFSLGIQDARDMKEKDKREKEEKLESWYLRAESEEVRKKWVNLLQAKTMEDDLRRQFAQFNRK